MVTILLRTGRVRAFKLALISFTSLHWATIRWALSNTRSSSTRRSDLATCTGRGQASRERSTTESSRLCAFCKRLTLRPQHCQMVNWRRTIWRWNSCGKKLETKWRLANQRRRSPPPPWGSMRRLTILQRNKRFRRVTCRVLTLVTMAVETPLKSNAKPARL